MARKTKSPKEQITPKRVTAGKILFLFFCILLFLSIFTYHSGDDAISDGGKTGQISNAIGYIGAWTSRAFFHTFGLASYIFGFFCVFASLKALFQYHSIKKRILFISGILLLTGFSILFALWPDSFSAITSEIGINSLSGGVLGQVLSSPPDRLNDAGLIRHYMGTTGTCILSAAIISIGLSFIWEDKILIFLKWLLSLFRFRFKKGTSDEKNNEEETINKLRQTTSLEQIRKEIELKRKNEKPKNREIIIDDTLFDFHADKTEEIKNEKHPEPPPVSPVLTERNLPPQPAAKNQNKISQKELKAVSKINGYNIPPLKLLDILEEKSGESKEAVQKAKETLQDTLDSFGVEAKVSDAITGPRITRLEVIPSPGVRLDKITSLCSNIKLDLRAESIRILAPIPGKDAVGIEIPNKTSSPVSLMGTLSSTQWKKGSHEIPIALGKSVSGDSIIADLARAPHLLIAGSTGSGKSVCINTLIMSLLYKFSPFDLRMILVDPKVVEFEIYKTLPHLITPIVNEPKKVPLALRWAINEMEKRYRILAKVRVKNLEGFNSRAIKEDTFDDEGNLIPQKLPFIVIILDELADIMMLAKADVETSICRIAQKARAVGIHLVVATQRPSKEIITGVIKANLPTRIAFKVSSMIDSRVILDQNGAEALLGRGDMLFVPPGTAKLERIQGAMVSDAEIERVVAFCSEQMEQNFDESVVADEEDKSSITPDDEPGDKSYPEDKADIFDRAVEIVKRERKATTSYLQRRLGIGYNKAANIIETMEKQGMISPILSSDGKREIYLSEDDKRV